MNEHTDYYGLPRAGEANSPTTQERTVEDTTQENPAVSKLREAFDTARNAIIEGSELAKIVTELRATVSSLSEEVSALHRDLDYVRNRNKELDEQVTQVRSARDGAIAEAREWKEKAVKAENDLGSMTYARDRGLDDINAARETIQAISKERDDAQMEAMRLDDELNIAKAKLAKVEALFKTEPVEMPKAVEQPRTETGQFQPKTYDQGSQGQF